MREAEAQLRYALAWAADVPVEKVGQHAVLSLDDAIRAIAREEIASLAGLVLRRSQDLENSDLAGVFGEALRDFTQTTSEPGPNTGTGLETPEE